MQSRNVLEDRLGLVLCVHQFLEGAALGLVGKQCGLSQWGWIRTCLLFSLSLPSGVAAGVAAQLIFENFDEHDAAYCWVFGLLNAFAAGTLAHVGIELMGEAMHESSQPPLGPMLGPMLGVGDVGPPPISRVCR